MVLVHYVRNIGHQGKRKQKISPSITVKGLQFKKISDISASTGEKLSSGICEQQRLRPACASMQTDQRICHLLFGKYHT